MTVSVLGSAQLPSEFSVRLSPAPRRTLHGDAFQRTDCNSPIHIHQGRLIAFISHYMPIGHTYRRIGERGPRFTAPLEPIRIIDDPAPDVGKWIESTWRDPAGRLYGWYHAEDLAPCPRRLFVPRIGGAVSDDDGLTWRLLAPLLRAPSDMTDCGYLNGFLAGGYGDFSVVIDRERQFFYLHYSSYVADEKAQGIAVARYPIADRNAAQPRVELWRDGAWQAGAEALASPIYPAEKGWRHPDPTAFWGPAVHYNRDLGVYVMLLNRTEGGKADIRQEGIYCAFNEHLDRPQDWSKPICFVKGGGWYPQIVGEGPEDGDTSAGAQSRFFMTGFSAWQITFNRGGEQEPPLHVDWFDLLAQFSRGPHGAHAAAIPPGGG